jgi:hypothetical protein
MARLPEAVLTTIFAHLEGSDRVRTYVKLHCKATAERNHLAKARCTCSTPEAMGCACRLPSPSAARPTSSYLCPGRSVSTWQAWTLSCASV